MTSSKETYHRVIKKTMLNSRLSREPVFWVSPFDHIAVPIKIIVEFYDSPIGNDGKNP